GGGVSFGEVDYRLTAQDKDTYQVDQLKLPAEIPVVTDGKTKATLKMASGPFSATWSTPMRTFLKFAWEVDKLSISVADEPDLDIHADSLTMNADGKDNGKQRLDQNIDMVLSNLAIASPSEKVSFKVAKVDDKAVITGFDVLGYQQQMQKLRGLIEKLKPAGQAAGAQPQAPSTDQSGTQSATPPADGSAPAALTDDDRKALADIVSALPKTISSYTSSVQFEGIDA